MHINKNNIIQCFSQWKFAMLIKNIKLRQLPLEQSEKKQNPQYF